MEPEIKAKWVAALRSGQYEQGCDVLRSASNKFCCLGVLYDILAPDSWVPVPGRCYLTQDNFFGVLPPVLADRVNLSDTVANRLIDMNDREGKTFAEIADYIEQHA